MNCVIIAIDNMMTSSNGNIFRVSGLLCGEFTGPRWIPCTRASDAVLMFSLICARINGWVNNREAGDLRRYQAHCDVIVMILSYLLGAKLLRVVMLTWGTLKQITVQMSKNPNDSIHRNAFENIIYKMTMILFRPQWDLGQHSSVTLLLGICNRYLYVWSVCP